MPTRRRRRPATATRPREARRTPARRTAVVTPVSSSSEALRQMAAVIRDVFWMACADFSRMLYVSPAYEDVWGLPASGILADPMHWFQLVHSEDRERVRHVLQQLATRSDAEVEISFRIEHRLRGTRMLHVRCFRVAGAGHAAPVRVTLSEQQAKLLLESRQRRMLLPNIRGFLKFPLLVERNGELVTLPPGFDCATGLFIESRAPSRTSPWRRRCCCSWTC